LAMAQDLEQTISALQTTAIGNCRKRIEEAAHKPKKIPGGDPADSGAPCRDKKPKHGMTSVLRDKYGL
jgi:hypothetical protein